MAEQPRLWGIDVIGGIYTIAALLMVFLVLVGSGPAKIFFVVMMMIAITFALGMFSRNNSIRKFLVGLLYVAAFTDLLFVVIYIAALFQFIHIPNKEPDVELIKIPSRFGLTIWMILYLRREDVREAFVGSERPADSASDEIDDNPEFV